MTESHPEDELDDPLLPLLLLPLLNGDVNAADLPFCCFPRRRLLRMGRRVFPEVASEAAAAVLIFTVFVGTAEVEIGEADAVVPGVLCRNIWLASLFLSLSGPGAKVSL